MEAWLEHGAVTHTRDWEMVVGGEDDGGFTLPGVCLSRVAGQALRAVLVVGCAERGAGGPAVWV